MTTAKEKMEQGSKNANGIGAFELNLAGMEFKATTVIVGQTPETYVLYARNAENRVEVNLGNAFGIEKSQLLHEGHVQAVINGVGYQSKTGTLIRKLESSGKAFGALEFTTQDDKKAYGAFDFNPAANQDVAASQKGS
ncbi:hypothetical protein [Pseudomonas sp. SDO52101_S400]